MKVLWSNLLPGTRWSTLLWVWALVLANLLSGCPNGNNKLLPHQRTAWCENAVPAVYENGVTFTPTEISKSSPLTLHKELKLSSHQVHGTRAAFMGELYGLLGPEFANRFLSVSFGWYLKMLLETETGTLIDNALEDGLVSESERTAIRSTISRADFPLNFIFEFTEEMAQVPLNLQQMLQVQSSLPYQVTKQLGLNTQPVGLFGCIIDDLDADKAGPSLCLTPEIEAVWKAKIISLSELYSENPTSELSSAISELQLLLNEEISAYRAFQKTWAYNWSTEIFNAKMDAGLDLSVSSIGMVLTQYDVLTQLKARISIDENDATLFHITTSMQGPTLLESAPIFEVATMKRNSDDTVDFSVITPSVNAVGEETVWGLSSELLGELLIEIQDYLACQVDPDSQHQYEILVSLNSESIVHIDAVNFNLK